MTTETEINRRGSFVASVWPWLAGGLMLIVYLLTFHHSATPYGLDRLTELSGWNWRPQIFAPVTFLVTYPLRWLPAGATALGMNLFNAVCAALALVLLARSVALLPHDRTNEQRQREQSETAVLTIRSAWLPPLFAVLVCGLQTTFWENAVEFRQLAGSDGGAMFNLLLFAYAVRCLLEYRVSQRESWLSCFALVIGLGMANDWLMIALFPGFLIALVWMKGFEFFNWRFLLRTLLWGLAGLSLILLFPLAHAISLTPHFQIFRFTLHLILGGDKTQVLALLHLKGYLLLLAISSVLPILLMGIRWAASFGDSTPIGIIITTTAFNLALGFLMLYCFWNALDGPFSPRALFATDAFLPLYYLGALSAGYFSGYFLLVFGARPVKPRQRPQPLVRWFNRGVIAVVWLLAVAVPAALVGRSLPLLQKNNTAAGVMDRYFSRVEHSLPNRKSVLLSDDPFLLHELQSTLVRDGKSADYLLMDTTGLQQATYVEFLTKKYPQFQLSAALTNNPPGRALNDEDCIHLVEWFATNHPIYYLHPSYGYYFERFHARPSGLVYELQFYPTNEWEPPPPTAEELAENRTFWQDADADLAFLVDAMKPPVREENPNPWQWFQQTARLVPETARFAAAMGKCYSRPLNYWGVELAKAGFPADAGKCYALAAKLNPGNASAKINLEFNQGQLAGVKPVLKPIKAFEAEMGDYLQWFQVINGGPVDEPSFCSAMGMVAYLGRNNYRQAVEELERARALMPDDLTPLIQLSQAFLYIQAHPNAISYAYPPPLQTGSNALAVAEDVFRRAPDNPAALSCKAVALLQLGRYELALPPLNALLDIQSTNYQVHYYRGYANLQLDRLDDARKDYEFVVQARPDAYQVYYNLGDIAYKQKDNPSAIKYYELFLAKAPAEVTNSPEARPIFTRLEELKTRN